MFGELHNPHAYCFDLSYGDPDHPLPFCDYPTVFIVSWLYTPSKYICSIVLKVHVTSKNRVCKDYRWPSVESTIAWVRGSRAVFYLVFSGDSPRR